MPARKVPMNQLEIAVPAQNGRVVAELTAEDVDAEYARQMGVEALARQRELYEENRTCTCGEGDVIVRLHKPGCKARPLTKSGNRS